MLLFLGKFNVGEFHSDEGYLLSTPGLTSCFTSFLKTANTICGTVYGLSQYYLTSSLSVKLTGSVSKSPKFHQTTLCISLTT